jgi:pimeloyl-ACP methyl ester carboxylesterase
MQAFRQGYINAGAYPLHYIETGSGSRLLLAFHGYGNDAGLLTCFMPLLGKEYTILSFDLPHHGKSTGWPVGKRFLKEELAALVTSVCSTYKKEKVSLVGYSMGGRVCLNIVELLPEKTDRVLLIAPDGLHANPFYYFLTRTAVGNRMFRNFRDNPRRYLGFVNRLKAWNLLDPSRYKFVMHYMETAASRNFLYAVWPAMGDLLPDRKKIKQHIRSYHLPVDIFMGAYDRVIPVKYAQQFMKGLPEARLHVVEKGHRLFDADTLTQMANCLLHK